MCCCTCPPEGYVPLRIVSYPTAVPERIVVHPYARPPHYERHLRSEVRVPVTQPTEGAESMSVTSWLVLSTMAFAVVGSLIVLIGVSISDSIAARKRAASLLPIAHSGLDAIDRRSRKYVDDVWRAVRDR